MHGTRHARQACTWPTLAALTIALVVLTGCSHVVTHTTPYFQDGPWQVEGPQGELEAGTRVLVVGREGTYSQVWSFDAVGVYVWNGALRSVWEQDDSPEAE